MKMTILYKIYIFIYLYTSGVVSGGYARIIIIWDICCIVTLIVYKCVCICKVKKKNWTLDNIFTLDIFFCNQHQNIF